MFFICMKINSILVKSVYVYVGGIVQCLVGNLTDYDDEILYKWINNNWLCCLTFCKMFIAYANLKWSECCQEKT